MQHGPAKNNYETLTHRYTLESWRRAARMLLACLPQAEEQQVLLVSEYLDIQVEVEETKFLIDCTNQNPT